MEWCAIRIFLHSHPIQTQSTSSTNTSTTSTSTIRHLQRIPPPIRALGDDERVDRFSMDAFPTSNNVIITGDFNTHHGTWDPSFRELDRTFQLLYDWVESSGWETLNSGAATRSGYGTASPPPTASDVSAPGPQNVFVLGPQMRPQMSQNVLLSHDFTCHWVFTCLVIK